MISKKGPSIRFIDDPASVMKTESKTGAGTPTASDLFVWINEMFSRLRLNSYFLQHMQTSMKTASAGQYADGSFKSRIAELYHDGAGFIIAADPAIHSLNRRAAT